MLYIEPINGLQINKRESLIAKVADFNNSYPDNYPAILLSNKAHTDEEIKAFTKSKVPISNTIIMNQHAKN
jgi:hypothetical protein